MQKEEDTGAAKLHIEKKGKAKKENEKERPKNIRMREKQNSCLIISDWSENMPFLLQNSFFAILVVIRQKPVQKEQLVKNAIFFATRWPSLKDKR